MNFRLTSPQIQLSENDVERTLRDVLRAHRYYVLRLQSGKFLHADKAVVDACRKANAIIRWATVGEPGIPDYVIPALFIEAKRPGAKLLKVQKAKHDELLDHWYLRTLVIDDVNVNQEYARLVEAGVAAWIEERRR